MNMRKSKKPTLRPLHSMQHRKMIQLILLSLFLSLAQLVIAQDTAKQKEFRSKYELKEVVVLSRHNIRAPLSGGNSVLGKVTTHTWTDWTANPSELTLKGGVLETMMGQYFRKWFEAEGLFKEGYCPNTDEVNIYANSMQRTIATAEYFNAGFLPTCNRPIYHRFTPSKMDPIFFPRLTKVSEEFKKEALKEISDMGGEKGIVGINESLKPSYETVKKVIDMKNSRACKEDTICDLNDYNTKLKFVLGEEPNMSGTLKLATQIADALILQYYEVTNDKEASFGNTLATKDWENISKIKDVYGDVLFSAPIVAVNVANPLLIYMRDELKSKDRKFTYLVGHDSNISSLTSALGFESYLLPLTIERKTPIGSKLIFEKWVDKASKKEFIKIKLLYQTTDQLRYMVPLSLKNPPASFPMKISGLQADEFGLYRYEDVISKFDNAITRYEDIK